MGIYATGDIHGHLGKLEALINKLPLTADDRLIFLGDYIDRGPDSRGVISLLLQIKEQYDCVFLLMNHWCRRTKSVLIPVAHTVGR